MKNKAFIIISSIFFVFTLVLLSQRIFSIKHPQTDALSSQTAFSPEITLTDDEWRKRLTAEQYHVLRERGTDIPFTHLELLNEHRPGTFVTVDCDEPVFRSETKFDSGTGWPSFTSPIEGSVVELPDNSLGISRTEVVGKKCGGHLGHVFDDGPAPTGKRYCINASALKFIPDEK